MGVAQAGVFVEVEDRDLLPRHVFGRERGERLKLRGSGGDDIRGAAAGSDGIAEGRGGFTAGGAAERRGIVVDVDVHRWAHVTWGSTGVKGPEREYTAVWRAGRLR